MGSPDYHPYGSGFQVQSQRLGNLTGEPLLHLEAPGEAINQPGQFGKPDYLPGNVADIDRSRKRKQMMFAKAGERDLLQDHYLIEWVLEDPAKNDRGVFLIALSHLPKRFDHPFRSICNPWVEGRIGSDSPEKDSYRFFHQSLAWSAFAIDPIMHRSQDPSIQRTFHFLCCWTLKRHFGFSRQRLMHHCSVSLETSPPEKAGEIR